MRQEPGISFSITNKHSFCVSCDIFNVVFLPPLAVPMMHGLGRAGGKIWEGQPGRWRHSLPGNAGVMLPCTEMAVSTARVLRATAHVTRWPSSTLWSRRATLGPL